MSSLAELFVFELCSLCSSWCLLVFVGVCWCLLVFVGVCWCLLVFVGVCWCLLVFVGVCCVLLDRTPNKDVCRSLVAVVACNVSGRIHLWRRSLLCRMSTSPTRNRNEGN